MTIVLPEPTSPTTIRFAALSSLERSILIWAITSCCSSVRVKGKFSTKDFNSPFNALIAEKSVRFPRSFFMWLNASTNFKTSINSGLKLPSTYISSILLGKCICISVATSLESKPSLKRFCSVIYTSTSEAISLSLSTVLYLGVIFPTCLMDFGCDICK